LIRSFILVTSVLSISPVRYGDLMRQSEPASGPLKVDSVCCGRTTDRSWSRPTPCASSATAAPHSAHDRHPPLISDIRRAQGGHYPSTHRQRYMPMGRGRGCEAICLSTYQAAVFVFGRRVGVCPLAHHLPRARRSFGWGAAGHWGAPSTPGRRATAQKSEAFEKQRQRIVSMEV
jgi:hypothetical protein